MTTQSKWLLVSLISTLAGVGVAAAQPGGGRHFEQLDTNGDGVVTTAEFEAGALSRWTQADANKDGKVTAEEFKAARGAHMEERFAKRDANGNGKLERGELARMPDAMFERLDANKDGALSEDERSSCGPKHSAKLAGRGMPGDENHDGVVTKEEAVAGAQKWAKKLDANGDGTLTREEFMSARPPHGHGFHHPHGPRSAPSAG